MKKLMFWIVFIGVGIISIWWLGDIFQASRTEYAQLRGATDLRQAYAKGNGPVGIAAAGDWQANPSLLRGIRLAAEQLNSEDGFLGRQLNLIVEDDRGSLDGGFKAAQNICDRSDILFVIGHSRDKISQAVVQNYEFYGVLMMSPTTANLTRSQKNFKLIFSNAVSLDAMSSTLKGLALEKGWSRIGMIYDRSEADAGRIHLFESMLKAGHIKIPWLDGFFPDKSGIATLVHQRPGNTPMDAMVIAASPRDGIEAVRMLRETGFDRPLILAQALPPAMVKTMTQADGEVYQPVMTDHAAPQYHKFHTAYSDRFNAAPDMNALFGYDTLMILAQAVETAGSLIPGKVAMTLKSFEPKESLTGTLGFDASGNAVKKTFRFSPTSPGSEN